MVMTVILVGVPRRLGLGGVVGASVVARLITGFGRICRKDCAALVQIEAWTWLLR